MQLQRTVSYLPTLIFCASQRFNSYEFHSLVKEEYCKNLSWCIYGYYVGVSIDITFEYQLNWPGSFCGYPTIVATVRQTLSLTRVMMAHSFILEWNCMDTGIYFSTHTSTVCCLFWGLGLEWSKHKEDWSKGGWMFLVVGVVPGCAGVARGVGWTRQTLLSSSCLQCLNRWL